MFAAHSPLIASSHRSHSLQLPDEPLDIMLDDDDDLKVTPRIIVFNDELRRIRASHSNLTTMAPLTAAPVVGVLEDPITWAWIAGGAIVERPICLLFSRLFTGVALLALCTVGIVLLYRLTRKQREEKAEQWFASAEMTSARHSLQDLDGIFQEGDEVETRGKGKVEWTRGKIITRHSDASFDIECQDGDVETNVQASFIRMLPGSPSKANKAQKAAVKDLEMESADAFDHVAAAADCLEHNSAAIPATHETDMDDVKTAAKVSYSQTVVAVAKSNDVIGIRKKNDGEGNATKFEEIVSDEKSLRDLPIEQRSDDNNELRRISDTHKEMQEGVLKDQKIIAMTEQIRLLERRYKSSMEELTRIRALQADPGRDPKIRRILDSLVLLREAPSRWDRLRSAFFRRCKVETVKNLRLFDHVSDNCLLPILLDAEEAISRNREVQELRIEVKRLREEMKSRVSDGNTKTSAKVKGLSAPGGGSGVAAKARTIVAGRTHSGILQRFLCDEAGLSEESAYLLVSSRELLSENEVLERERNPEFHCKKGSKSGISANGKGTVTFYDLYDHRKATVWGLGVPPFTSPASEVFSPKPVVLDSSIASGLNEPLLGRMQKLAGLADEDVAIIREALVQRALRRSMAYRLLHITFRCLVNYALWAREKRLLERRLAVETAKSKALEDEYKRKVAGLQSQIFSLEDNLRTLPRNNESKLRAEISELREKLKNREEKIRDAAARVHQLARVELLLKNTQKLNQEVTYKYKEYRVEDHVFAKSFQTSS